MTRKQTKKQPTKVQLSKQDLAELLTVLKDFLLEELSLRLFDTNHRVEMLQRRVIDLEKAQRSQESKRVLACSHDDKFDSLSYSKGILPFLSVNYKCRWCERIRCITSWDALSRKEKKALKLLGVRI